MSGSRKVFSPLASSSHNILSLVIEECQTDSIMMYNSWEKLIAGRVIAPDAENAPMLPHGKPCRKRSVQLKGFTIFQLVGRRKAVSEAESGSS